MAKMLHSEVAKQIGKRITGFSTPIGGISWDMPKQSITDEVRKLLVFLEDRRIFHIVDEKVREIKGAHTKRPDWVAESINKIRDEITECLKSTHFDDDTQQSLDRMRRACRTFLDSPIHHAKSGRSISRRRHLVEFRQCRIEVIPGMSGCGPGHQLWLIAA
jgi:hypothetical protein